MTKEQAWRQANSRLIGAAASLVRGELLPDLTPFRTSHGLRIHVANIADRQRQLAVEIRQAADVLAGLLAANEAARITDRPTNIPDGEEAS